MPKCKDCGTFYRNMDHSVYDCSQAGGKEAQRMMRRSDEAEQRDAKLAEIRARAEADAREQLVREHEAYL